MDSVEEAMEKMREENRIQFESINSKLDSLLGRTDYLKLRLDSIEPKLIIIDTRIISLEDKLDSLLPKVEKSNGRVASIETTMDKLRTDFSVFRWEAKSSLFHIQEQVDFIVKKTGISEPPLRSTV